MLKLGEVRHCLGIQTKRKVTIPIATASLDTRPLLDLRQDESDQLIHKFVGSIAIQGHMDTTNIALLDLKLCNVAPQNVDLGELASDCQEDGTSGMQVFLIRA